MQAAGLLCCWRSRGRLLGYWLDLDEDGDVIRPTRRPMPPRRVLDRHFARLRARKGIAHGQPSASSGSTPALLSRGIRRAWVN